MKVFRCGCGRSLAQGFFGDRLILNGLQGYRLDKLEIPRRFGVLRTLVVCHTISVIVFGRLSTGGLPMAESLPGPRLRPAQCEAPVRCCRTSRSRTACVVLIEGHNLTQDVRIGWPRSLIDVVRWFADWAPLRLSVMLASTSRFAKVWSEQQS